MQRRIEEDKAGFTGEYNSSETSSGKSGNYPGDNAGGKKERGRVRPKPLNHLNRDEENTQNLSTEKIYEPVVDLDEMELFTNLDENINFLKNAFHVPKNNDVILREFSIGINPPVRAVVIFIEGMTDKALQNDSILQPLMLLSRLRWDTENDSRIEVVHRRLLPGNQIYQVKQMRKAISGVLSGDTLVLIEGEPEGLIMETKGWEHRGVEQPGIERVIRGPHEAFSENFRINTALIRKAFQSPDLITEIIKLGNQDRVNCGIMYLHGVANPALVNEIRRRVNLIETDYIGSSGILEQFMEDNTFAFAPQVLSTERPDRVVNNLIQGKVAVIVAESPHVLVFPVNFFDLLQTAEDAYMRWPYGSLLRIVRLLGFFLAIFLPGIYIAITAYHHEMIPTDLLLAIAGSREQIPFPTVVEVIIMELSFELIREAGIRIPGLIGTTLGIVGALILGQAAVAANIVSPILIVIVAVTAIGSFAIPNNNLALSVRFVRFVYIILGATLGIFGLVLGVFIHLIHLASLKSFGVPFLSPIGGSPAPGADVIWRSPAWKQEERPGFVKPLKKKLQPKISRHWLNRKKGGGSGGNI